MLKRGVDQVTGWVLAVVLSIIVFTGGYFVTKVAAKHGDQQATSAPHTPSGHGDEGHGEKAHGETTHGASEAQGDGHGKEVAKAHAPSTGKASDWDYNGSSGPAQWASLTDEFKPCKAGKRQSPVDIDAPGPNAKLLPIRFHYKEAELTVSNTGHTIKAEFPVGNYVEIDGERFDLVQLHFHTPSEHKVTGIPYDLEMHLVHRSPEGRLAYLAVLFEEGAHNKALDKLFEAMPPEEGVHPERIAFDPAKTLPTKRTFYRYDGSITTPPCTEGVLWHVLTQPLELSRKQHDQFALLYKFNARPVQPLNGRSLTKSTR